METIQNQDCKVNDRDAVTAQIALVIDGNPKKTRGSERGGITMCFDQQHEMLQLYYQESGLIDIFRLLKQDLEALFEKVVC